MQKLLDRIQDLLCNVLVAFNGGVAVRSGLGTGNVHIDQAFLCGKVFGKAVQFAEIAVPCRQQRHGIGVAQQHLTRDESRATNRLLFRGMDEICNQAYT